MAEQQYNLENIRALLTEGFSTTELRRLCYDTLIFRPIYDELAKDTGKGELIDQLIEYADRKSLLDRLLAWAKEHNLAKYEEYSPYYVATTKRPVPTDESHPIVLTPMLATWGTIKQGFARQWLPLTLLCLIVAGVMTNLLAWLDRVEFDRLGRLNDVLDLASKLLVLAGGFSSIFGLVAKPPGDGQESEKQPIQKNIRRLSAFVIAVVACGLLVSLWQTREHIVPTSNLSTSSQTVEPQVISITSPLPQAAVRIGDLVISWNPPLPQILEFYRENISIEKTSFPVLPGSGIYLNRPGKVVVKLWSLNGPLAAQVTVIVVGQPPSRTTLKLLVVTLFIVAGYLVSPSFFRNYVGKPIRRLFMSLIKRLFTVFRGTK